MDCIFCKIIAGEIPTDFVYQDDELVAFPDIHPAAPLHILIVPRKHIRSLNELLDTELPLVGRMVKAAKKIAADNGILERGYRIVINTGGEGGQVIQHLHMHLLGGKQLKG